MVNLQHNQIRRVFAATTLRVGLLPMLLVVVALLHGLLFVWLVPPWQVPDEPTQFAYAASVAALGRVPSQRERDQALEERVVASMVQNRFFERLLGHPVTPTPHTFDEVRQSFFMPDQIGNDPPLYFALASAPIALLGSQPVAVQLLALRLLGVACVVASVLCIYGAAGELMLGDGFSLAVGLLAALQPMFVFIGIGAGNDGLANLIGAAVCWLLLRIVRCGVSLRRIVPLAALVLLGVLTKRTMLPVAVVVVTLAILYKVKGKRQKVKLTQQPGTPFYLLPFTFYLTRRVLPFAFCLLIIVALSRDETVAANWNAETADSSAARVSAAPGSGAAALAIAPGRIALQAVPDVAAEWAQNQTLRVAARVWTADGTATGRVAIDYGWATVEVPFEAKQHGHMVHLDTLVPLYAPYLHIALRSEAGTIYADRLSAESDRRRGVNLLSNGDVAWAGMRQGSLAAQLAHFGRVDALSWLWRSGRLLEAPPLGVDLARIFFVSFWGQFGWMTLPLVGATPWEGALGLLCVGGLLGTLLWLFTPSYAPWRRRAVVLLLLLVIVGLLFPLLNAYTQPRSQTIQQGRYLFTAMGPVALLLVLGWRTLVPQRWHAGALVVGAIFGVCFAAAALRLVAGFYG